MAELPILYSFRRCPYAMRARLALLSSGTEVVLREVVLREKPAEFVAASAKATVPVLVLPDGSVLEESLDIMHWALRRHDPEHWLDGDNAALIPANDGPFKAHLDRYKYADRGDAGMADRDAALAWLAALDAILSARAYLGGEHPALADAAIMPFVRQFAQVDRPWFDAQPLPHLQAWLERQVALPRYLHAMTRWPKWQPGAPEVRFGRAGPID